MRSEPGTSVVEARLPISDDRSDHGTGRRLTSGMTSTTGQVLGGDQLTPLDLTGHPDDLGSFPDWLTAHTAPSPPAIARTTAAARNPMGRRRFAGSTSGAGGRVEHRS